MNDSTNVIQSPFFNFENPGDSIEGRIIDFYNIKSPAIGIDTGNKEYFVGLTEGLKRIIKSCIAKQEISKGVNIKFTYTDVQELDKDRTFKHFEVTIMKTGNVYTTHKIEPITLTAFEKLL
jgi:hypothetical protein